VIVVVLVAFEAVLVSGYMCRELSIVDMKKFCGLAMRMVKEQFEAAGVGELRVCADRLVTREVV
jgi:hypothetical protein